MDYVPKRSACQNPTVGGMISNTYPIDATFCCSKASFSIAESLRAFFSFSRAIFCWRNSEASSLA